MPASLKLAPHLTEEEIADCVQSANDPVEMRRWLALLLKIRGKRHSEIAVVLERHPSWVTHLIHLYNEHGPKRMADQRANNGSETRLSDEDSKRLVKALSDPPPEGGEWTGDRIKTWVEANLGVSNIGRSTIYDTLRRLGVQKLYTDGSDACSRSPRRWQPSDPQVDSAEDSG